MSAMRDALAFLTRLPVGGARQLGPARLTRAAALFPLVGLLVGGVLGGVRVLADEALPAGPATAIALAAVLLLTGALHEDGLADTADALGVPRERRLEVLRDPRIGAFGALAIGVALLIAWSSLSVLSGSHCLRAALVAGALGRWSILPQARLLRSAREDGAAAMLGASGITLGLATAVAVAAALLAGGLGAGAFALAATLAGTTAGGALVERAFGGVTGDTYGAVVKLVELCVYLVFAAAWS